MKGNAQTTTVFLDEHRFGRHTSEAIYVRLVKCENNETGEFFLLTKTYHNWEGDDFETKITDQVFRKPMEAMRAAINLWNQTVMENPVVDEPKAELPLVDGKDDFPF